MAVDMFSDVTVLYVQVPSEPEVITVQGAVPPVVTLQIPGLQGPPGSFKMGTITTGAPGTNASVNVTMDSNFVSTLNLTIPRGAIGQSNTLSIGTVTTGAPGSAASASLTGTSPNQTLNLTLPQGTQGPQGIQGVKGDTGLSNTLIIGTVTTGAVGAAATATLTGTAPNQTLNLSLPRGATGNTGPANSLSVGTVTTAPSGTNASATITGTAPAQTLSLVLPRGEQGPQGVAGQTGPVGPKGDSGPQGAVGPAGIGVPISGSAGSILTKASNTNYDTLWTPATAENSAGSLVRRNAENQFDIGPTTASTHPVRKDYLEQRLTEHGRLLGEGTVFPTIPLNLGDTFYHSGIGVVYVWNGTGWRQTTMYRSSLATANAASVSYPTAFYSGLVMFDTSSLIQYTWVGNKFVISAQDTGWINITPNSPLSPGTEGVRYIIRNGILTFNFQIVYASAFSAGLVVCTMPVGARAAQQHWFVGFWFGGTPFEFKVLPDGKMMNNPASPGTPGGYVVTGSYPVA